jgi:hypothetical protein
MVFAHLLVLVVWFTFGASLLAVEGATAANALPKRGPSLGRAGTAALDQSQQLLW